MAIIGYKDTTTGDFIPVKTKTIDTLPVGTEVDYDGETVPDGWSAISGYEEVEPTDYITISNSFTVAGVHAYKCGNIVFFNYDITSGTFNNGETQLGTCTNKLVLSTYGSARIGNATAQSSTLGPATLIANPSGAFRIHTSMSGNKSAGTIILLVTD